MKNKIDLKKIEELEKDTPIIQGIINKPMGKKKVLIFCFVVYAIVVLFGIFIWWGFAFEHVEKRGLGDLKEALIDQSLIEDAEVIEEYMSWGGMDYYIHVHLKIDVEKAKKATQYNILKSCVAGRTNKRKYRCSDPVWEVPEYSQDGSLRTSAQGIGHDSIETITINSKTGDLYYSLNVY